VRYYSISITDPASGQPILPTSLSSGGTSQGLTSLTQGGAFNPGALNIEFDIPTVNFAIPDGAAWLRVWGLGLKAIGSSFNLNGKNITIAAGMSAGLPLANPAQQGVILTGSIFQAFGNWIGLDQTVDINFLPGQAPGTAGSSNLQPTNFPFVWKKGTPLSTAIGQTLTVAYPGLPQVIAVSPNLILNHDETGYYRSLQQFGLFINGISKTVLGPSASSAYRGVQISTDGVKVYASDGTQPGSGGAKQIAFQDLLGQPTWLGPGQIQIKLVLRGDLSANQVITLPPTLVTQTAQSQLLFQNDSASFTGNYVVSQIRHYGNFRQPDAASWNTTVNAYPEVASSSGAPGQNTPETLST
jgi:hypothetical protein